LADYKDTLDFIDSDEEDELNENQRKYQTLLSRHDAIEKKLKSGWSQAKFVARLNETGMDITLDTFRTYLYRMRKAVKAQTKITTAKKNHSSGSDAASAASQSPTPDWNDVERLVGYRLSDEIRDYVSVEGNKVKENFPKNAQGKEKKMRSAAVREELTKLRREVRRK